MEIRIEKNLSPKAKPTDASALGFGKKFIELDEVALTRGDGLALI